jgi:hypothetical protein
MRMYSASGRSRWPYVIGAAVVVVAVGGGLAYANTRDDSTPTAISTSTSSPTTAPTSIPTGGTSGSGDNEGDAAPTGCLGGQGRDVATVLAAQRAGKHTTYGAVEVATTFYRWLWQSPYPSQSDAKDVSAAIMATSAPKNVSDLAGQYASAKDLTAGVVPVGTPFHMSTTNGIWKVDEKSTSDEVWVSLAAGYVIDGALSPTKVGVVGFVMDWENNAWHISSAINVNQTQLANGGTRYTGGC